MMKKISGNSFKSVEKIDVKVDKFEEITTEVEKEMKIMFLIKTMKPIEMPEKRKILKEFSFSCPQPKTKKG